MQLRGIKNLTSRWNWSNVYVVKLKNIFILPWKSKKKKERKKKEKHVSVTCDIDFPNLSYPLLVHENAISRLCASRNAQIPQ